MNSIISEALNELNTSEDFCEGEDRFAPVWKFEANFNERSKRMLAEVHAWEKEEAVKLIESIGGTKIRLVKEPSLQLVDSCKLIIKTRYGINI